MRYRPTIKERLLRLVCALVGHLEPLDARMRAGRLTSCARCRKTIEVRR